MRIRVEPVPIVGQPWVDTLDYHVRPAVERAGESFDAWSHELNAVVSPALSRERVDRILKELQESPLVRARVVE